MTQDARTWQWLTVGLFLVMIVGVLALVVIVGGAS